MINLIGKIQIALATSAERLGNIPLLAEPVWDTDENYLFVGDGVTYGGVRIGGDVNEIEANIAQLFVLLGQEVTDRTNADNALGSRIDQEIADRIAGDTALQAALDAVETSITDALAVERAARIAADNALGVRINNEEAARLGGDTALGVRIDTEVTNRTNADNALGVRIDNETTARTQADAQLNTRVDNLVDDVADEIAARIAGDANLQTQLNTEVTNRTNADNALGIRIDNETSARQAADSALDTRLTQEVSDRTAGDTALGVRIDGVVANVGDLTTDLAQEVTDRTNADTALGVRIDNEATARQSADTALGIRIDTTDQNLTNESAARVAGDTAINTRIDNLTKADVGLGNVDNTSDVNKPISNATQLALDGKFNRKGESLLEIFDVEQPTICNMYLDGGSFDNYREASVVWTATTYKSFLSANDATDGDVYVFIPNESGTLVVDAPTDGLSYIRKDNAWTQLPVVNIPVTSVNGKTGAVVLTKADVGLGNVDNTSDVNKPISNATQSALNTKADAVWIDAELRNIKDGLDLKANEADLSNVAFSGLYSDLLGKPTLGTASAENVEAFATAAQGQQANTALQPGDNVSELVNDAGYTTNVGTITSVNVTSNSTATGLVVSGGPVTASGTFTIALEAGTQKYTSAEATKLQGIAAGAQVNTVTSVAGKTGAVTLTKTDVGLSNVDNTSDVNKPISFQTEVALGTKFNTSGEFRVNLWNEESGLLGAYVHGGSIAEDSKAGLFLVDGTNSNKLSLVSTGSYDDNYELILPVENGTLVTDAPSDDSNYVRRNGAWTLLPEDGGVVTSVNGKVGDVTLTKADVGLGNVDNTSDLNKPISTATQTALNGKQNTFGTQTPQFVYAGPATGSTAATPTFRALVAADIPSLTSVYAIVGRTISVGTGLTGGGDLSANRSIALNAASIASLAKADTALQPAAIGTTVQAYNAGLTAWQTIAPADKANTAITISAGTGLTGGGNLSAGRTIALSTASIASLALADTAVQPGSLATVATSGLFADLGGKPTTVAGYGIVDAVPTARTISVGTGLTGGGDMSANRTIALSTATTNSLALANSSLQPSALGVSIQQYSANLNAWSGLTTADKANSTLTITAGNGLTGGGNLTANCTLTLATPGTLSDTSVNEVTAGGHTHQITGFLPLTGGVITGNLSVTAAMGVGTRLTLPEIQLIGNNSDTNFRVRMLSSASYAYIQAGNPANVGNTAGKLRFTGWLGTAAEEFRFDAANVNINGNTVMTVAGGSFTGNINGTTATFTGDTKTPVGTTLVSADTTVLSSHTNGIIKKTVTTAVTLTLGTNVGRDGDVLTIVNGGNTGNINITGSGITLYSNGQVVSTIAVLPKTTITLVRDNSTTWIT